MSDELIKKSDVLSWCEQLKTIALEYPTISKPIADLIEQLEIVVETEKPVNAVELPCEVGDKIFEVYRCKIYEQTVKGFTTSDRVELINCETKNFYRFELGKKAFLTREEAEKALEDLENG